MAGKQLVLNRVWEARKRKDDALIENFPVAKTDRANIATPGLFRALTNAKRNTLEEWSATMTTGGLFADTITFSGYKPLTSTELTVFLCLSAIAVEHRRDARSKGNAEAAQVDHDAPTAKRQQLRQSLIMKGDGPQIPASSIAYFSRYLLTKMVTNGDRQTDYDRVEDALNRLMRTQVRFTSEDGSLMYESAMISGRTVINNKDMAVALNPIVSGAILGTAHQTIKTDMEGYLSLREGSSRILFALMASRVYPAHHVVFPQDDLVLYLFGNEPTTKSRLMKRRKIVMEHMQDVASIPGWAVDKDTKGRYFVQRKKV